MDDKIRYEGNAAEFKETGYTLIRSFISSEEVELLKQYIEFYKTNFAIKLTGRHVNWIDKDKGIINSIHKTDLDPESLIEKKLHEKKLNSLVSILLGGVSKARCAEVFYKPAYRGLPSPPHQDNYYWSLNPPAALTCWLSLTGSDEENGGVYYYKRSHLLGEVKHVDSYAPGSSQMIPDSCLPSSKLKVIPQLKPGDVLFHHSLTIHGSGANNSPRDRIGITFQFQLETCKLVKNSWSKYLSHLDKQVKSRSNSIVE